MKVTSRITIETRTITIIRPCWSAEQADQRESAAAIEVDKKEVVTDAGEPASDRVEEIRGNNETKY